MTLSHPTGKLPDMPDMPQLPRHAPPDPAAQARLEAALPAALARIAATPGVYAALWCGSAARGEANRFSDLDVHALVTGNQRWRANYVVEGVPVEVFHNPPRKVRAMFREGEGDTLTMFAEGRVVLPHDDLTALQKEAQQLYAAGRPRRAMTEAERFALIEEVMDARAQVGQPVHTLTVMSALERRCLPALYATRGWWEVKREHWARDLQGKDAGVAAEVQAVLTAPDGGARQAAFEVLARRLTGDFVYREGHSEPQVVPGDL